MDQVVPREERSAAAGGAVGGGVAVGGRRGAVLHSRRPRPQRRLAVQGVQRVRGRDGADARRRARLLHGHRDATGCGE